MRYTLFAVCIAAAVSFAAPTSADARSPYANITGIEIDRTASQVDFDLSALSGYEKFRTVYRAGADQDLVVRINPKVPLRLYCMNVRDFRFVLTDQNGVIYRTGNPPPVNHGGLEMSGPIVLGNGTDCPYPPERTGLFGFPVDQLYPNRKAADYRLIITFQPRDKSVAPTPLPVIAFRVQ